MICWDGLGWICVGDVLRFRESSLNHTAGLSVTCPKGDVGKVSPLTYTWPFCFLDRSILFGLVYSEMV